MKYSKEVLGEGHENLVIIFPHWQAHKAYYYLLSKKLAKNNCVLLYSYSPDILSSDIKETLKNYQIIRDDADDYINNNKFRKVAVVGCSTGSFISFFIAKKNKKISKIVAVSIASKFTDVVWHNGDHSGVKKIKQELIDKNISQAEAEKGWRQISPEYNLDRIKARVLLIISEGDKTIKYKYALEFIDKINKNKISCQIKTYKDFSHAFLVLRNLIKTEKIVKFINDYEQD